MASHRIVGSEVGRSITPGAGSLRVMNHSRRRRFSGWGLLLAPMVLIGGAVAAVIMWPFR